MNLIISFGKKLTADNYVREVLISSRGDRSTCSKKELEELLKNGGIKPMWNDTKSTLYDKIISNKVYTSQELAKIFHVGIPGRIYAQQFKISLHVVRQLEKENIIHVVGEGEVFDCGKRYKEHLYDVYEFESMNAEKISKFNEKHKFTT